MATLDEIAGRVASKLDVSKRAVKVVARQFLDEIVEALEDEEPVVLHKFGRFYFTYQTFNEKHFGEHVPPGVENPKLRICRFKFGQALRNALNGIAEDPGIPHGDPARSRDYKRVTCNDPARAVEEANRRAKANITIDDVCREMERRMVPEVVEE